MCTSCFVDARELFFKSLPTKINIATYIEEISEKEKLQQTKKLHKTKSNMSPYIQPMVPYISE